jgi:hypothetical protein
MWTCFSRSDIVKAQPELRPTPPNGGFDPAIELGSQLHVTYSLVAEHHSDARTPIRKLLLLAIELADIKQ